jgi:small subunit ribosomal protein S20
MANTSSAKKRIRQTAKRTERNRARTSRMRTFVKKAETAIEGGNATEAAAALAALTPELMRAARKGVIHKNTMARKLSRLTARAKKLAPAG